MSDTQAVQLRPGERLLTLVFTLEDGSEVLGQVKFPESDLQDMSEMAFAQRYLAPAIQLFKLKLFVMVPE